MNQSDSIELKFDFPEMQKWNILTNRANSRWKKGGIICLFIILLSEIWPLKCQNLLIFDILMAIFLTVLVTCLSASRRSFSFRKCCRLLGWAIISNMTTLKSTEFGYCFCYLSSLFFFYFLYFFLWCFYPEYLTNGKCNTY